MATPLPEQRKALLGSVGAAVSAVSAYVFNGGDLASVESAVAAFATAVVAYLFVYWTPNA